MASMNFEDILGEIRNKIFYPVYFLMGEESYNIDTIADSLEENVLTPEESEFNLSVLYGRETDVQSILNQARRYPMMGTHHLVMVREAQNIKDVEELLPYVLKPLKSTILVICYKYKSYDRRKKFVKEVEKVGVVFESKKLYDYQMPDWISKYVKRRGYRIGPRAVQLLADHLGTDLGKIVNEISKVFISLPKGEEITIDVIEQNIGISKDFNIYELQQALVDKDSLKAFQIVRYFSDNPKANPLPLTLGALYVYFSRLMIYHQLQDKSRKNVAAALSIKEFFVPDYQKAAARFPLKKLVKIISWLRECDTRSKGVDNQSVTEGELFKELVYKAMNL